MDEKRYADISVFGTENGRTEKNAARTGMGMKEPPKTNTAQKVPMTNETPAEFLRAEHMDVGYGKRPILRDIALQAERGRIVTLIGPNGAGKSTILKSIIKELPLLSGTVYLEKENLAAIPEEALAKRLSVLMTERVRPELFTCREVAAMGRYPYTGRFGILSPEDERKVDEALALVHAEELADRWFHECSDGQKQRILLARAICQEPELLVLDEPTTFLDIRYKLELLEILRTLAREQKTAILLSLHELELAERISDYVVCVGADGIRQAGTPEEIFSSGTITELYGISKGSYQAELGLLELSPAPGTPQVFVIGGNGRGIPVYRRLAREGIPFIAGILHENDLDFPVAKALAAEVIAERPFAVIREENFLSAKERMLSCGRVICCLQDKDFGEMNAKNRELYELAKRNGLA